MSYLIDTCVVSDFFKKNPAVVKIFELTSPDEIYISSITVMEIEYGLRLNLEKEKKIRPLWKDLLNSVNVIAYSSKCAIASASVRANLKNKGLSIGPYDVLIAGTSLAYSLIIVTSNIGEFRRIPNITIEDWRNKEQGTL
jgi:tRNA(fMet)-specific endonuclease VapC